MARHRRRPGIRFTLVLAGLLWTVGWAARNSGDNPAQDLQDALDRQIHRPIAGLYDNPGEKPVRGRIQRKLVEYYHDRDMEPLWTAPDGPNGNAGVLRHTLDTADSQGLNPADYSVAQIARYWEARDPSRLARLELLLTLSLADYIGDLAEGRRAPRRIDPELFPTARDNEFDPTVLLRTCLTCRDLREFLEEQAPPFAEYRGLRRKLAEFRALAAAGGWPQVPSGRSLKPGARDPRVPALRKRLGVTGELAETDGRDDDETYGESLVEAVNTFQRRHGLAVDGIVGRATTAAMNVTAGQRVRQIIVNMESWRWVSRNPGDWLVTVNIPSFELRAVKAGRVELAMPVIVGQEYNMTPVFTDRVRYVEVNPYWDIPESIAEKEMLPKLREDSGALGREHIRLFRGPEAGRNEVDPAKVDWAGVAPGGMAAYRLRQDPGPWNSLGRLAFIFPNEFAVYLHDTPAKALFERTRRAFSHGCIRVARPKQLAVYLLGGEEAGWDERRVDGLIAEGNNRLIHLERPVPIFILYNTAFVDPESGVVYYYNDVYGRDVLLEKALF